MENKFELVNHTADVAIIAYGNSLSELFENAALGMYTVICENFTQVEEKITYENELFDTELEPLLVCFLNDLIYQTFVNKIVFSKFIVKLEEGTEFKLKFCCFGEIYQPQKHGKLTELKAATYHELKILKNNNLYSTKIVFDV